MDARYFEPLPLLHRGQLNRILILKSRRLFPYISGGGVKLDAVEEINELKTVSS